MAYSIKLDIRSFHGLASFYMHFIINFSSIIAYVTKVIKGTSFIWSSKAQSISEDIKNKLTQAPMLALLCFNKVFKIEFNAFGMGIGGVLTQKGKPLAFLTETLCD